MKKEVAVINSHDKKCPHGPEDEPVDIIVLVFSDGFVRPVCDYYDATGSTPCCNHEKLYLTGSPHISTDLPSCHWQVNAPTT